MLKHLELFIQIQIHKAQIYLIKKSSQFNVYSNVVSWPVSLENRNFMNTLVMTLFMY